MSGYIGSKASVTQVDGYNRTEADDRYVNVSGDTMTGELVAPKIGVGVSGSTYQIHNRVFGNSEIATQYGTGTIATLGAYAEGAGIGADGTVGVKIDSAGRVTMPYQPMFRAWKNNVTVFPSGTPLTFSNTIANRGNHWNGTSFVAPVNGVYHFSFQGLTHAVTNYFYSNMSINGVDQSDIYAHLPVTDSAYMFMSWSGTVYLYANDSVSVQQRYNGGTPYFEGRSGFSGYLLG